MRESSKGINRLSQINSRIYAGRYKWSLIKDNSYIFNVIKYIYLNPIKTKLVREVEDYPYYTIQIKLGIKQSKFVISPLFDSTFAISNHKELAKYCNEGFLENTEELISKALHKPEFQYPSRTPKQILSNLTAPVHKK